MSYDLMVFDPATAPRGREPFMMWYSQQTKWAEDHNYQDHAVTSDALKAWYLDMIKQFPPMNGPLRSDDFDDPKVTDYSVGHHVIYAAFGWSQAEMAHVMMRKLAVKHAVGFFDVSSDRGEILFPPKSKPSEVSSKSAKPFWKFW